MSNFPYFDKIISSQPCLKYIPLHVGDIDNMNPLNSNTNSFIETTENLDLTNASKKCIYVDKKQGDKASFIASLHNSFVETSNLKMSILEEVLTGTYIKKCLTPRGKHSQKDTTEYQNEEKGFAMMLKSNFERTEEGYMELINKPLLQKQKKVLGYLIRQFGSAIFSGRSIMSISLPIAIFESRSNLERVTNTHMFAPAILSRAEKELDLFKQFKISVTFLITTLCVGINPEKPFNPVLGETFQGSLGDCLAYSEQISHHPPVSAFQMYDKNYTINARREFKASMSTNSVRYYYVGCPTLTFKNTKNQIMWQNPQGMMTGTAFGKRQLIFDGRFYIFDLKNKYYCELEFNISESFFSRNKKRKDYFRGKIWRVNDLFIEKLKKKIKKSELSIKIKEKKYVEEVLEEVEGYWTEYIQIGKEVTWRFGDIWPPVMKYLENPLPSDSNYRLDIIYLKKGNEEKAQEEKLKLEDLQRRDSQLRKNYVSKMKK